MSTLTVGDDDKTVSITLTDATLGTEDAPFVSLLGSVETVNAMIPMATTTYGTGTCTITMKDARLYVVNLNPGPPVTAQFVSTSYWKPEEFTVLRTLAEMVFNLVEQHGMTAMTITYA